MGKRFSVFFILLAFILTIGCLSCVTKAKAFANEVNNNVVYNLETKSKAQYLVDAYSGTILHSKNECEKLPIASMCKIMTLLLCFEAIDNGELTYDQLICVSENASKMGGSQVFLEANGEYPVGELIKSIVVASANDSCVALAENISGSTECFVEKMNEKAKILGMDNTVFVNCTGLPKPGQYSCAKDVSIMFRELIKHEDYFKFSKIWTDFVLHPKDRKTEITNTNKLIRFYQGCDGGKTGYTSEAGHCLVACANRNGLRLVSVVISAPDSKTRFNEVSSMFNYGFANYVNKKIIDCDKPLDINVEVVGGKKDSMQVVAVNSIYLLSQKNQKRSFEIDFEPITIVKAPIKKGDYVGTLYVYENGIEIAYVKVVANEDVKEKTFFDIIKDIGKNWAIC